VELVGGLYVCVWSSEVRAHDGIESVIALVKAEQATLVDRAIAVLVNMSKDDQLCDVIVDSDVIPALIQALSFQLVLFASSQHSQRLIN